MSATALPISPASPPQAALFFNPRHPDFNKDPYACYQRLRDQDPVHRSPLGVWFLGRYEDVRAVLKDRRFGAWDIPAQLRKKNAMLKSRRISPNQPDNLDALIANSENWFAFLEAPDHTRLRALVSSAFEKRNVEKMRHVIRRCAEDLLDRLHGADTLDVMADYACQLPQNVIAALLGLPAKDFPQCVAWANVISRIFDPLVSLEEYARLNQCSIEFMDYLRGLIARRRAEPRDDLISALIQARTGEDRLSDAEMISTIIVVFGAGEETVISMIGNGALALMRHPEQRRLLLAQPGLMNNAVEEILRYDTPLQMTSRTALQEVQIGGKTIREGDQVYVALGSANRDPERFTDPDVFDIRRERIHHLSFADGAHYCVGSQLARIEAQEAFAALLDRFPTLRMLPQELSYREHTVLRCMNHLFAKP
ncbi:cytochrome P450 [Burkholderia gladioli]|nr:cytochrome P450 [Burkholderia gladioli]